MKPAHIRLSNIFEKQQLYRTSNSDFEIFSRERHSTIQQSYGIINSISKRPEEKKLRNAVLLDVAHGFDKV